MKSKSHFSRLTLGTAVLAAAFVISPAHAGDDAREMSLATGASLTEAQVREVVATAGYVDVYDIDIERDLIEVKAFSADGQKAEIYVDSVTGDLLRTKVESDDRDDDYRKSEKECG